MMILLMTMVLLFFNSSSKGIGLLMYLLGLYFYFQGLGSLGYLGEYSNLNSWFGIDYLSFYLILLSIWLVSIILLIGEHKYINMLIMVFIMFIVMMFMFIDLVGVFLFFEASILPIFFLILFFGHNKERYMSGMYMLIYTLMSSLPSLMVLMYLEVNMFSLNLGLSYYFFNNLEWWIQFILVLMFLIKTPIFLLHIWLPKAHVEAPACGSMLLAGLMLKMGGYMIIRLKMMLSMYFWVEDLILVVSLIGSVILVYLCFFQSDLKVLVAYSSVIHMSNMLVSFFSGVDCGLIGGIIMMLGHGICSAWLFYMVNEIYLKSGSRLIYFNKGINSIYPVFSFFWLIALMNNLGVPPCVSVISEIMMILSLMMYNYMLLIYFVVSTFVVTWFMMGLMYTNLCSIDIYFLNTNLSVNLKVYMVIFIFIFPLNFLILFLSDLI